MSTRKIYGFIPARMGSSRFYGKPLYPIAGIPMIAHVIERAKLYKNWDGLFLTTCDEEIKAYAESLGIQVIMTSSSHTRALDRIAEAVIKCDEIINNEDIVLNVQGDEPMLQPDMINATIKPMIEDQNVNGTVLAMDIINEEQFNDPNSLKIIYNLKDDILYTSRSPIPYCKKFSTDLGAKRIYGIFGFRWKYLKLFTELAETRLEVLESCDSNRFYDNGLTQRIAPYPYIESYSVDVPSDVTKVESYIKDDPYYSLYKDKYESDKK